MELRRLALALALACSACGGNDATITRPTSPDQFYLGWFQIECAANARCCPSAQSVADCSSFKATYLAGMAVSQIDAKIADGKMVFDPAAAAACLAARRAAWASCSSRSEGPLPDCLSVFRGTVPDDGACTFHFCDDCIPPPIFFSDCLPGSFCYVPGDQSVRASGDYTGVCQPFTPVGAACQNAEECASDHCQTTCQPLSAMPIYWGC